MQKIVFWVKFISSEANKLPCQQQRNTFNTATIVAQWFSQLNPTTPSIFFSIEVSRTSIIILQPLRLCEMHTNTMFASC